MNHIDWEKHHHPSGAVEANGTVTVSGTGDVGPVGTDGARGVERTLAGLPFALLILIVVAVRFAGDRRRATPTTRGTLAAKALVVGGVTFVTGLVAVGIVIPMGSAMLTRNGIAVTPISALTGVRVVAGVAAALALATVTAFAIGAVLRRGRIAATVAIALIAVPYAVAALPLVPDALADWLLRVTPAAGFAAQQTMVEYPQVVAHYAPSAGYLPLAWWAGLAVMCTNALVFMTLALRRGESDTRDWR